MKKIVFAIFIFFSFFSLWSQPGGKNTFAFLDLKLSPYVSSLQGATITQHSNNPTAIFRNPALLDSAMEKNLALSYNNYLSDVNFGTVAYTHKIKSQLFHFGIQYVNYGKFDGYDIAGNPTGTFTADDYAFCIGTSKSLNKFFTIGGNIKAIYSQLFTEFASGVALDLGLHYKDSTGNTTMAFVIRNAGFALKNYNSDVKETMPLRMELGFSKRLEHTPFRFNLLFHNLQQLDMRYIPNNGNNNATDLDGTSVSQKIGFGDNLLRHITLGTELLFTKNTHLRLGYNHQMRRELAPFNRQGLTGFSWGFGMVLKKVQFNYASSSFFPGINTNQFSAIFSLDGIYKRIEKKKTPENEKD